MELTLEEVGNALADGRDAVAGTVGADRTDHTKQLLGPLQHVRLIAQVVYQHIALLEQRRVLEEAKDLAEEGDGLLVELLGVADVGRDDLLEGQVGRAICQRGPVFLRLDGQLTAHGVLGLPDVRVDVVDVEPTARVGRHGALLVQRDAAK
jgi:hypothetical protein